MSEAWRSVCIKVTDTADNALRVLDAGGLRIALVTDDAGRLLGVISDGDIRRAILRRQDFSEPVTSIMNSRPTTVPFGTSREIVRGIMQQYSMMNIPVLDRDGRLVGLETFHDLLSVPKRDNWVVLMAGGFGTRLQPLTNDLPKPLLIVGDKPILETILEGFIAAGFHRFCISLHYRAQQIREYFGDGSHWGVTIRYVEEDMPLGTAGALGLLGNVGNRPVIMMNGDLLTKLDFNALIDFHESMKAAVTLCVREYDMQVPFGVVEGEDLLVRGIVEKPVHRFFVNAGVYVVSPEVIAVMRPACRIDMPDLVKTLIADKRKVPMFPIHEYWIDIGRPDDFHRAQQERSS
jgi:dTDP-glucose pyrophosphorylase